jgi:RNase P subunit RPR2
MMCKNCDQPLMSTPEFEFGEWFVRCLSCGAKNIVTPGLHVIAWRW